MDEVIKNICHALKEEAEAVISYTDKISFTSTVEGAKDAIQALESIRLDEIEHIQNLTLELTKIMTLDAVPSEEGSEEVE